MMLGKLQRAHPTLCGHFAPAYLVGSNMLRAYLLFIYGYCSLQLYNSAATHGKSIPSSSRNQANFQLSLLSVFDGILDLVKIVIMCPGF